MADLVRVNPPSLAKPSGFSHAVIANGILFTAHLPIRPDGSAETGSATEQAELALSGNFQRLIGR